MMTAKVYCDHGSLTQDLRHLQAADRIEIVTFPYDDMCHKIKTKAIPSAAQIRDLHMPINQLPGTFDDYQASDRLTDIQTILGNNTRCDALHVDSAAKSGCSHFFTMDKNHILAKRAELQQLLGIKFLHPRDDWTDFLADLNSNTNGRES